MESRPDLKLQRILENVRQHFGFLFGRGFCLVSVIFVDRNYENWQITMATHDWLLKVYSYMGEVNVALSTMQIYNDIGLFELEDLIYLIKGGESVSDLWEESPKNETQRFQRLAWLLEKYIDDIMGEIGIILILPPTDDASKTSSERAGQLSEDNCPALLF